MASTDAFVALRNAPYRLYWVILNEDETTATYLSPLTGGLGGLAATRDLDGGGMSATSNSPVEIGTTGYGYLDLTASEMRADHVAVSVTSTTAAAVTYSAFIKMEPCLHSGVLSNVASTSQMTLDATGSFAAVATDDYYNGHTLEIVRGNGAGQARVIEDYTSGRVVTLNRAFATIPNTSSVYRIHPAVTPAGDISGRAWADVDKIAGRTLGATQGTMAALMLGYFSQGGWALGTVQAGTTTTSIVLAAVSGSPGLSSTDDAYNSGTMVVLSSTNVPEGQVRKISDYTGSSTTLTLASATVGAAALEAGAIVGIVGRIE